MEVTDVGIVIEARDVHSWKAACPMEVTDVGIDTKAREVH